MIKRYYPEIVSLYTIDIPLDFNQEELSLFINGQLISPIDYNIDGYIITLFESLDITDKISIIYENIDIDNTLVTLDLRVNESNKYNLPDYNTSGKLLVFVNGQLINGLEDPSFIYGYFLENNILEFYIPLEIDDVLFVMYNLNSIIEYIEDNSNKDTDSNNYYQPIVEVENKKEIAYLGDNKEVSSLINTINNLLVNISCSTININSFVNHHILYYYIETTSLYDILAIIYSEYELNILWKLYIVESIIYTKKLYKSTNLFSDSILNLHEILGVESLDCIKLLDIYYKEFINIINDIKSKTDINIDYIIDFERYY